ncbi:hypothetical protein [Bacillus subtilis]|uniref:hypothetical protein n=1 Tax=Bacillus subtilis TaxID=1423 RepID=UPI001B91C56D|nr:hypothetical protein [Bacillus subtilis]CAF1817787.1 hypothetical protein NRS6121_02169 [Bacillus subtilis]CAI6326469.1 hypothetical protein NRS6121_21000 [Bacillus subtilis]
MIKKLVETKTMRSIIVRGVLWIVFFVFCAWYHKPVGWLPFDIFITVFVSSCIFAMFGGQFLIMDIMKLWREKKKNKTKR